jgi:hypothetical protein
LVWQPSGQPAVARGHLEEALALLLPYPAEHMHAADASMLVNSVKNDDQRLPVTPLARGESKPSDDNLQKDW